MPKMEGKSVAPVGCRERQKGNELIYAGKVDHGFDNASAKDLQARLKPLICKTQPYAKKIAYRPIHCFTRPRASWASRTTMSLPAASLWVLNP